MVSAKRQAVCALLHSCVQWALRAFQAYLRHRNIPRTIQPKNVNRC